MCDRFTATPEGLRRLAVELGALCDELDEIGAGFGPDAAAVGHFALFERLASVAGNWTDRRRELVDRIERLAGFAGVAAAAYAGCEADIAGAFAARGGPTGTTPIDDRR